MRDDDLISGWPSIVDKIVRGENLRRPAVVLGATPDLLKKYGLSGSSMMMTVAKLAECRKKHPQVPLEVWYRLPLLLEKPLAIFPSRWRDGSVLILVVEIDRDGHPIIVAAVESSDGGPNAILSVYGKEAGMAWVASEIEEATKDGLPVYQKNDFAASLPQPPIVETTSSSHGLIPSDGTAKPKRNILSLRKDSTKS